jgi:hypothetical protein
MDHAANVDASSDLFAYIDQVHGAGSDSAVKAILQYASYRNRTGVFASQSVKAAAKQMRAGEWWDLFGNSCPELQFVARRCLSAPISAGAGERNWSTYGFIVDKRRNKLASERSKKLVFAHYNIRALRKVKKVDYESEFFVWDEESLGLKSVESDSEEEGSA